MKVCDAFRLNAPVGRNGNTAHKGHSFTLGVPTISGGLGTTALFEAPGAAGRVSPGAVGEFPGADAPAAGDITFAPLVVDPSAGLKGDASAPAPRATRP